MPPERKNKKEAKFKKKKYLQSRKREKKEKRKRRDTFPLTENNEVRSKSSAMVQARRRKGNEPKVKKNYWSRDLGNKVVPFSAKRVPFLERGKTCSLFVQTNSFHLSPLVLSLFSLLLF